MKKQIVISFIILISINAIGQTINGSLLNPTGDDGDPYWWIKFGKTSDAWGGFMWNNNAIYYGNGDDFTIFTYGNRDINFQPGSGNVVFFPSSSISGNVGIGVLNPLAKLSVDGYIKAQGTDGRLMLENPSVTTSIYLRNRGDANQRKLEILYGTNINFVMDNNGNIGVGETNPSAKLELSASGVNKANLRLTNTYTNGKSWELQTGIAGVSDSYFGIKNITDGVQALIINSNGNAALYGKFEAKEIKVQLAPTADFVFNDNYELKELKEIESFIKENRHLPDFPSGKEIEENGVNLGEMDAKLLQKIEELTLYVIDINKEVEKLKKENELLKEKLKIGE